MNPGDTVIYHHGLLDEDIRARVFTTSQRGVVIEFDDDRYPRDRRFLTHPQAAESLRPSEPS